MDVRTYNADVLVVGSGIAGIRAAVSAGSAGARVLLASSGPIFSGSSFFGGTWGLGLIAPEDEADEADLIASIVRVGQGAVVRELVETFVHGIRPAVAGLEARGCKLKRAARAGERDFIPCFDHKHRSWYGLGRSEFRAAMAAELERLQVTCLPARTLLDIHEEAGRVCGASLCSGSSNALEYVVAPAVVLATGGLGGLYERTLTMPDVLSSAHAVALAHGAQLFNAEFIQIMPGLVSPEEGVVFNERTFKYVDAQALQTAAARCGYDGPALTHELLDARSNHGPFSASLPDCVLDFALAAAGEQGLPVSYHLPPELPEFMQTYMDWFCEAFGKDPSQDVRIVPYAHASNGGILIDTHARVCGAPSGLFACGECTGGMHGADRIGGLSSANALVFGEIAGRSAALEAQACTQQQNARLLAQEDFRRVFPPLQASPEASRILACLRHTMSKRAMIVRTSAGLTEALRVIAQLADELENTSTTPASDAKAFNQTVQARQALVSAKALVKAMLARPNSLGAHYRADN